MISLKIYTVISKFSVQDLKKFEKFASSKFLKGRDLSGLVRAMRTLSVKIFPDTTNKEYISLISGKMKLKESVVSNRLSDLNKLAEYFLLLKICDKDKVRKNFLLLQYYLDEKNFSSFDPVYIELENLLLNNKYNFHSIENITRMYELASQKCYYVLNYEKYQEFNQKKNDYSIAEFITDYLRSSIEILQQNFYEIKTESNFNMFDNNINIPDFISKFKSKDLKTYYLMNILYYNYLSYRDHEKISYYKKSKDLYKSGSKYFDDELSNFLQYLNINYCINKINKKHFEYYEEVFNIINSKFKKNLFYEIKDQTKFGNVFSSYINIGLRLKKYKWVKDFIEKYEKYLPQKTRNDDRNINFGKLLIHKGEYIKAFKYLNLVKKTNSLYYTESAFYKIQAYYFLNNFEAAIEEIGRFKSYLSYHKDIPEFYLQKNLNQLKDIDMLIKFKTGILSSQNLFFYFSKRKNPPVPGWILDIIKNI